MTELTGSFDCDDLAERANRVRALARSIVADESHADDLAQQVLLQEMSGGRERGGPPRSRGWFVRVLHNLAIKDRRATARRGRREAIAATRSERESCSAADAVEQAETLRHVVAATLELEEPYRSTILLRFLHELSVEEVSRVTGAPASTVRVRTKRGIERLRESLRRTLGGACVLLLARFAAAGGGAVPRGDVGSDPSPVSAGGVQMIHPVSLVVATAVAGLALALGAGVFSSEGAPAVVSDRVVTRAEQDPERRAVPTPERNAVDTAGENVASSATPETAPPLELRVVDPSGAGVAGATVRVYDQPFHGSDRMHSGARVPAPVVATTDADGRASVSGRHPFGKWGVEVRAEGFAPAFESHRPDQDGTVRLHPATALEGVVTVAETGAPLQGVEVRVADVRHDGERLWRARGTTTGEDGRYRLEGIAAGRRTRVEFAAPGRASWFATLDLEATDTNDYDVALTSGARVEILSCEHSTGRPIAGVRVLREGFASDILGETDERGRLVVEVPFEAGVSKGWPTEAAPAVRIERDGYCATWVRLPSVSAGKTRELRIPMVASGSVHGVVRDTAGEPVAGARVAWQAAPLQFLVDGATALPALDSRETVTDERGAFVMRHVPIRGRSVEGRLRVESEGRTAFVDHALPPEAGTAHEIEIVLGNDRTVAGRAFVNGMASAAWIYLRALDESSVQREHTRTLDDGRFAFFAIPPGKYAVEAVTADGTAVRSEPVEIEVGESDLLDVHVHVRAALGVVRGRVLHDDGTPVAGASVLAFRAGTAPAKDEDAIETPENAMIQGPEGSGIAGTLIASRAQVAADGTFELAVPDDARALYQLGVYQGGFGVLVRNVRQGMNDVELRVPALAPVRLELRREKGAEPVARVGVRWEHAASGREVTLAWRRPKDTLDGVLSLELPIGRVELTLRDADTGRERTLSLEVGADGVRGTLRVDV